MVGLGTEAKHRERSQEASQEDFRKEVYKNSYKRLRQTITKAFEEPEQIRPSEWAEKYVELPRSVTRWPGQFSWDRGPYARDVFDTIWDPEVQRVTLICGTQLMKTMLLFLCGMYAVRERPVPIMMVMATSEKMKDVAQRRLHPILEYNEWVNDLRLQGRNTWKTDQMRFDGCDWMCYGGNSTSQVSSDAVGLALFDEIDDWSTGDEKEGGIFGQAQSRTKSYGTRAKTIIATSPTIPDRTGWREYKSGSMDEWEVPCPFCDHYQVLKFKQFWWPKDIRSPSEAYDETKYRCEFCEELIDDEYRTEMQLNGRWVSQKENRRHRSFRLASFNVMPDIFPWGYFSERFLKCYPQDSEGNAITKATPYPEDLQVVVNHDWCKVWEQQGRPSDEDEIMAHRDGYNEGEMPEWPVAIIITADLGEHELHYIVCAHTNQETIYLLRHGTVAHMDELADLAHYSFTGPDGKTKFKPTHGYLDCGYDIKDPQELAALDFCDAQGWMPIKGHAQSVNLKPGKMLGHDITLVNSDHFKGKFWARMAIPTADPGSIHFHRDTTNEIAAHCMAEYLGRKKMPNGQFKKTWIRTGPNHKFDCFVYQMAAATEIGVRLLDRMGPAKVDGNSGRKRKGATATNDGPGGW